MRKSPCALSLCVLLLIGSVGLCQVLPSGTSGPQLSLGWAQPETLIWGLIGRPTLHVSWAAVGSIKARATASGGVSGSVLTAPSVTNFGATASGEGKLEFDARGLWLGATVPVRLSNSLTLRATGEYFFPFRDKIWASAAGNFSYSGPGGAYTGTGLLESDASSSTRRFFVDAELAYSGALPGRGSILAGVRYDRLVSDGTVGSSGNFTVGGRSVPSPFLPSRTTVELNSVTPYLGIRTWTGGPFRGLTFEIKGFPAVVFSANGRYKRQRGYFGEFKADYHFPLASNLSGSFFMRGDVIHASFKELTSVIGLAPPLTTAIPPIPASTTVNNQDGEVATSVDWKQLALGGSLVLSF
jgi:hypothetical protein